MKRIGFLSFGHWGDIPGSRTRSARDALLQAGDLAVAAEDVGVDGRSNDRDGGLARFGRSYVGEPDRLVEELSRDAAVAAEDTLLVTVPNQLGVDFNVRLLESISRDLRPALGWD